VRSSVYNLAQILEKKYEKQIKLFEQSIRSEYTKNVYLTCLRKYFEFPASIKKKIFDETDSRKVEVNIIDFVISLKKQGKGFGAIHNYVSAVCKYYSQGIEQGFQSIYQSNG
jgi:hypothetical protein